MQRNHALSVALKDRPKLFQVIVVSLFSLSVITVIISIAFGLQASRKSDGFAHRDAKPVFSHSVYASFSTTGR